MPVNVPSRNALASRQARPLTGKEVADAIENHLLTLSTRLMDGRDILSDQILSLQDQLKKDFRSSIHYKSQLHKVHLTYPKVGWSVRIRLEEGDFGYSISADIELDLERNLRLNLRVGESGFVVLSSIEDEKIPQNTPDKDRQKFSLPVTADFLKPDGTVGKVDIEELRPSEKRAARTVDVGRGAEGRVAKPLSTQGENGLLTTVDVLMTGGEVGQEVILPNDPRLPEVTLDVVASPPIVEKAPPTVPLPPPKSMAGNSRPNVKFKK